MRAITFALLTLHGADQSRRCMMKTDLPSFIRCCILVGLLTGKPHGMRNSLHAATIVRAAFSRPSGELSRSASSVFCRGRQIKESDPNRFVYDDELRFLR